MRILQISSAVNFGGGERHLVDLSKELQKRGHTVFAALRPENKWRQKLSFLPDAQIKQFPLRNSIDFFSARQLAKFAVGHKIEIIHAHVARDYPVAALASYLSKIPLVLTRHLLFRLNPLHRLTIKQAEKIIAVSNGVAESLLVNDFIPAEKIKVIYNGVDIDIFESAARNLSKCLETRRTIAPDAEFLAATVGELSPHKGQEDFICAAAIVARKFPDAKFLIVGADNSKSGNYRIYLEKLVEELKLKDRIIFTGWQNEMPTIYAAIDVFVSAARREPFGLVIAEAMAGGTAVVATETVGASEILENNVTGILTPIKNPQALADAISELFENIPQRESLEKAARLKVKNKFSLDEMRTATENVYTEIVANKFQ